MLSRSLPAKLSPSYLHGFLSVQHADSLPPSEALRKLFPRFPPVQHAVSLPPGEALRKLFPRFPLRPACWLAPSQRSFPQAICTVSSPSSMLSRSLPAKLSVSCFHGFLSVQHAVSLPHSEAVRKLFARFPVRPACCLAPSQRSSPQAISTASCPSSMLSRSLPAKLSASYLHGFLSVQHAASLPPSEPFRKLFARFPTNPACCLAPSQRSSPQAICTVSCPSSMLSRSLPAKLSPTYFHGFLSVQHAVSLPPSEAFRKLFARFPVCPALSRSLPAKLSASYLHGFPSIQHTVSLPPQAICTVSSPSSMLSRSLPAKLSVSYLHGFLSVQHAVSLPPSEALRKLFAQFPVRPALSRSLPAKLSASYLHGFLSVQYAVSLPPSEALPKLFARFPVRPACCLAPSQRNFPQAISMVSSRPAPGRVNRLLFWHRRHGQYCYHHVSLATFEAGTGAKEVLVPNRPLRSAGASSACLPVPGLCKWGASVLAVCWHFVAKTRRCRSVSVFVTKMCWCSLCRRSVSAFFVQKCVVNGELSIVPQQGPGSHASSLNRGALAAQCAGAGLPGPGGAVAFRGAFAAQ